jgi:quercetin dioxygenase-like cupin family protein
VADGGAGVLIVERKLVVKHVTTQVLLSLSTLALMSLAPPAWAVHGGEGLQWGDAPPVLPKGAKLAVLQGDPGKAGPFVMRLQLPKGYKVAPHSHSQAENVTVLSGNFMVGMGDKADAKAMKTMGPGTFGSIPAKTNHYAMAKTPVILQIHGEGPFDLTYVDPKDDPSKQASK